MGSYRLPTVLSTSRLLLRRFQESDQEALFELYGDPECTRYTVGEPLKRWDVWRLIATHLGHWELRGYGSYAVVEKASGAVMGLVGLWHPGDWPEPELAYAIARRFWGHGYVSEAGFAVQQLAAKELGWKRLISMMHHENVRSKAVARRLGGEYEKTIPFRDGQADVYAYALAGA